MTKGVTGGVDTHLDTHVAAALDPLGRLVSTESFDADAAGYKALLTWLEGFGQVDKIGVKGTGSHGVGLARFLRRRGVEVIEVNRPNRQSRRSHGKSDPLDAVEAARAVISGRAFGSGKSKDGAVEAIRVLMVAKRSARQARVKAIAQMRHLVITAPDQLRSRLKGLTVTALVAEAAKLRAARAADPVTAATKASRVRWLTGSRCSRPSCRTRWSSCQPPLRVRSAQLAAALPSGQSRSARFGVAGPPQWRATATRARTPVTYAGTTGGPPGQQRARGESPWSGSRTTPRPPTTSSDG